MAGAGKRGCVALLAGALLGSMPSCQPPDRNGAFGELAAKSAAPYCPEFRVGYDLMVTDFGVAEEVRPEFAAYAQAMGDYVTLATRQLQEVTSACKSLALDFGGSETDPSVKGRIGEEASYAWCNLAIRELKDAFSDSLAPAGHFTAHFAPADCFVDSPFIDRCEAGCGSDAACQEKPLADRCDKGLLAGMCNGKCTGTCEGSASVPALCEGTCDAMCTGRCLGSCYGTCNRVIQAGGRCSGECLGTCEGSCMGKCTGVCHFAKGAAGKCDGPCKGGCAAPLTAPKCSGDLAPPSCPTDERCEASCRAVGEARASCTSPSVTIALGDDITKEIQADLAIQTKIRSLEASLPALFGAAQGRGTLLEAEAKAAFEAGDKLTADRTKGALGNLGVRGSACAVVMQAAGEQSIQDLHVAVDAAKSVLATLPSPK